MARPTPHVHVLVTARDAGGTGVGRHLLVPPLDGGAARTILTRRLAPVDAVEEAAAAALVERVARQPLVLDVMGAAVAAAGGPGYRELLGEVDADHAAPPVVAELSGLLPGGAAAPIVAALTFSIRDLADEGVRTRVASVARLWPGRRAKRGVWGR